MKYQRFEPIPLLKPYVKCFWTLEGGTGIDATAHRLFADALPNLVFHYQNSFYSDNCQSQKLPQVTLAGHNTNIQDMYVNGTYGIFGVCVYPWVISEVWGLNARLVQNQELDLSEVLGLEGYTLGQEILDCPNNLERTNRFQRYLLQKLSKVKLHQSRAQNGIQLLVNSGGNMDLGHLAHTMACSIRTLERAFKKELGMSPKTFARILRFQNSLKLYEQGMVQSLTQLAYSAGYYDQPHFIKEFRLFSGMPPKHYFKKLIHTAEGFAQL